MFANAVGEGIGWAKPRGRALIDLGATVNPQTSATPEPATYTMFLAGLGAVGICKKRLRRVCRS